MRQPGSLAQEIRERIREAGPISFAEFMRLALYDPRHGYYARRAPGPRSDFVSAPSLSPWFGRLLAALLERAWDALSRPEQFTVVEVGPGAADLAGGALRAARPPFSRALRWHLVEPFEEMHGRQRLRLGAAGKAISWSRALEEVLPAPGCVLLNEVLDNFPVHLLEVGAGGGAAEVYVGLDGEDLVESLGPLSAPELADHAARAIAHLEEGDRFEVCLQVYGWCREAAAALERGYLIVVDYGDVEPSIWTSRPAGSLVTYSEGRLGVDPLEDPGTRDITAHVNFSLLERAAAAAGYAPQRPVSQREVLNALGIERVAAELREAQEGAARRGDAAQMVALLAERSRVGALAARGGLGDHLVLIAAKGAPPLDVPGADPATSEPARRPRRTAGTSARRMPPPRRGPSSPRRSP